MGRRKTMRTLALGKMPGVRKRDFFAFSIAETPETRLKPHDVSLGTALGGGAAVDKVPEAVEEGFGGGVNSESAGVFGMFAAQVDGSLGAAIRKRELQHTIGGVAIFSDERPRFAMHPLSVKEL